MSKLIIYLPTLSASRHFCIPFISIKLKQENSVTLLNLGDGPSVAATSTSACSKVTLVADWDMLWTRKFFSHLQHFWPWGWGCWQHSLHQLAKHGACRPHRTRVLHTRKPQVEAGGFPSLIYISLHGKNIKKLLVYHKDFPLYYCVPVVL